ncbi:MAG TPA: hypothetical protein VLA89_15605 [Gemmatimonadales bacterium]|nr:hypothetical protein [Gemmatimonadales bacterium]
MYEEPRKISGSRKIARRAPSTFDGNHTDDIPSMGNWLFTDEDFAEKLDEAMEALLEYVEEGNLRWFLLPMDGYRI